MSSAVNVNGAAAEVLPALLVAVTVLVPGAAGPAALQEYVVTPVAPGVAVQPLPRAGNA